MWQHPAYLTIKSIVEPGYDGPHYKDGYAAVVESAEEAAHVGRVAGDGVEQGGAGQAEDGADEEEQEDELVADTNVVPAVVAERLQVEDDGGDEERDEADEVRPGDDVVKPFFPLVVAGKISWCDNDIVSQSNSKNVGA